MENESEKATELAEKGSNVQVSNYHKQLQAPFVTYIDFESKSKRCLKA